MIPKINVWFFRKYALWAGVLGVFFLIGMIKAIIRHL